MVPPSPGLPLNPAGRTQEALLLSRALLTVGSPRAHFTNKGNSTILWRCQKVNRTLRKSSCAPGPLPSYCRAAPFPPGGRWGTAGHRAGVCRCPPAYLWPARAQTRVILSSPEPQLPAQPAERAHPTPHDPLCTTASGDLSLAGWWVCSRQREGSRQSKGFYNQTKLKDRVRLGISDLLSEVSLSPATLPHHSEPCTPHPVNGARAAWAHFTGVWRGQLHRPVL